MKSKVASWRSDAKMSVEPDRSAFVTDSSDSGDGNTQAYITGLEVRV
jgi:hypothetical protein